MYVEERIYRLKIGAVAEYCRNYEELGMKTQLKHLPHMVGYYFTEIGGLNCMVHLWAYDSLDQREKCRAAMSADPDWQEYLKKIRPLMKRQESRIMKCAPFFVDFFPARFLVPLPPPRLRAPLDFLVPFLATILLAPSVGLSLAHRNKII